MNIKKGNIVYIITGNEKGKTSEVLKVLKSGKLILKDINKAIKHKKSNEGGSRLTINRPIHISNVKLFENKEKKI